MSDSKLQGGSPRLYRLRTDRLASVNIELCTDRKLGSLIVIELDDTLPCFTDDIGMVFGPPTDYPSSFFAWKTVLGRGRTRPDPLTVNAKGGHS
jgi:hypothetical protein